MNSDVILRSVINNILFILPIFESRSEAKLTFTQTAKYSKRYIISIYFSFFEEKDIFGFVIWTEKSSRIAQSIIKNQKRKRFFIANMNNTK